MAFDQCLQGSQIDRDLRSRVTFSVRVKNASQETKVEKHLFLQLIQKAEYSGTTFLLDKHKNAAQKDPA